MSLLRPAFLCWLPKIRSSEDVRRLGCPVHSLSAKPLPLQFLGRTRRDLWCVATSTCGKSPYTRPADMRRRTLWVEKQQNKVSLEDYFGLVGGTCLQVRGARQWSVQSL